MAAYNKFNNFVQYLGQKEFAFAGTPDTLKVMLTNTAPVATNSQYSDISANELANGGGYTTGGATATIVSWTNSSGTSTLTCDNTTWTGSGAGTGSFRYAVLYDSTTGYLIGWWDYGSSISLASGDTFTVAFNSGASSGSVLTIA